MTEPDINATIAKLRAETERLDLENRKRSAEMTRDLLESMHRQRSVLRKPNALTEWFPTLLTGVMVLCFSPL